MRIWLYKIRDSIVAALIWGLCVVLSSALLLWDAITRRKSDPPEIGHD